MNQTARSIVAVIAGAVVAVATIAGAEGIGRTLYPPPGGVDLSNPEQLRSYMRIVPTGLLLFVLFGWLAATFIGGIVASLVARERVRRVATTVAVVVLIATAANFLAIPHPAWFMVVSVLGIILAGFAAGQVMSARTKVEG
jgi:hypothetical protein